MPATHAPAVFVSSTCYDLSEIRDELKAFIEGFGFDAMLSEFNSFPINPRDETIVNCTRNVQERADILVLVVGKRYGSEDASGKSVTNLEYLQARSKGIPIYVFILRSIIEVLPVWKANPSITVPGVDSIKLLEFVDSLRSSEGVWCFSFDKGREIADTLRKQWAFLFLDALHYWTKARNTGLPKSLQELRGESLRLVIERPPFWEHRLFSQHLDDCMSRLKGARRDWESGFPFGNHEHLESEKVPSWIARHTGELVRKLSIVNDLLGSAVQTEAFGPVGQPGDPEKIVYLAERMASFYGELIEWSQRCRKVSCDERFFDLLELHAKGVAPSIAAIDQFADDLRDRVQALVKSPPKPGEEITLRLNLVLTTPDGFEEQISKEIDRLLGIIELPPYDPAAYE